MEKKEKSEIKKKRQFNISTKTFIFVSVVFTIVICMVIFSLGLNYFYEKKFKSDLMGQLRHEAEEISHQLLQCDFDLQKEDTTLDSDIDEIASILGGRILVVDRGYQILKDSAGRNQGSYMISDRVIAGMTGGKTEQVRYKASEAELMYPVVDGDGQVQGLIIITGSMMSYRNGRQYIIRRSALLLLVVMVLCILAAAIISQVSVRELEQISKLISQMSNGNLDIEMPIKGFKETRKLARNYNAVLKKLNSIDTSRQEFVSNVSHELKTPVTSMKVLAESLLQNEDATAEMYREFMTDIVDEIDRETKIINDLLVLVKTERQSAKLNIEETDINALIDVILKRVTPIANQRGIELIYESYREVSAEVDEVKLSLALANLIENAIKYNVDNGWVKVSLNADHKNFYIKVADGGVGIPDDCKDMVFERFYRVDKARSRDTGGTGLGLAIARNAILVHDGTIKLYSESGKGTTFTVKVPLKHEATKQDER
jgi:signal transduction histidine kinase